MVAKEINDADGAKLKELLLFCRKLISEDLMYVGDVESASRPLILTDYNAENVYCCLPPKTSEDAKYYVSSLLYLINPYSENKDMAANFFEILTSVECRYTYGAPIIYGDTDKYEELTADYSEEIAKNRSREIYSLYPDYFKNAKRVDYVIDTTLDEYIIEIFRQYIKDEINIDSAVKQIYDKLVITIKE